MKNVLLYPIIIVMIFILGSCAKSDKTLVKETGEKFMIALLAGDLATANTLVTPATSEKWGATARFLDDVLTPEWKAELEKAQSKVSDVEVSGDEAYATVAVAIPALVGEVTVLHFKKVNGKWLIDEPGILVREVVKEETQIIDSI